MQWELVVNVENFLESLLDEDEGDQSGEVLLGKPSDITHKGATKGNQVCSKTNSDLKQSYLLC